MKRRVGYWLLWTPKKKRPSIIGVTEDGMRVETTPVQMRRLAAMLTAGARKLEKKRLHESVKTWGEKSLNPFPLPNKAQARATASKGYWKAADAKVAKARPAVEKFLRGSKR